jgi:hypothetical protein
VVGPEMEARCWPEITDDKIFNLAKSLIPPSGRPEILSED